MNWKEIIINILKELLKPKPTPSPTPSPIPEEIKQLFDLHNQERDKLGLKPLTLNNKLNIAAQKHSDWMAKNNSWNMIGENIASGQKNPQQVMQSWMNSSGHKANILNSKFKDVGFGIASASNGMKYWTTDFASSKNFFQRLFGLSGHSPNI